MREEMYPMLDALMKRGPAAYTGEPLSFLLVEVRNGCLHITGAEPLQVDGDSYVREGAEYCYVLEGREAEKLLSSLCRRPEDRPERILADTFEFARPDAPLKDYLDGLQIVYTYHRMEGASLQ